MLHAPTPIQALPHPRDPRGTAHRALPNRYAGPERRTDRASAAEAAQWFGPMLDEIDYGMLLLNDRLEVLHVNHVARGEMGAQHPLQLQRGALHARRPPDAAALLEALQSAARRGLRRLLTVGESPHEVNIAVVPLAAAGMGHAAALLVVLGKRVVCGELAVQWFARNHALTHAETRVLTALCDGLEPGDIACGQGTSMHTIRTQISSVRAKTGASNIRALIRQVSKLPPLVSVLRNATRACDNGAATAAHAMALSIGAAALDFADELPA